MCDGQTNSVLFDRICLAVERQAYTFDKDNHGHGIRNAMPASVGWLAYQPDGRPLNLITIMGHTAQANVLPCGHMSLLFFQLVRPTLHPTEASSADGAGADNDN